LGNAVGQVGMIEDNSAHGPAYGRSQARLHQQEYGSRRPSLRRTGDGIKCWSLPALTIKSAK
jgi:hypothetical protein